MKNIVLTVFQVLSWTLNLKEKIIGMSINMKHSYELLKTQKGQSLLFKIFKCKYNEKLMRFHIRHHGD